MFALVVSVVTVGLTSQENLPPVTAATLRAAKARWSKSQVQDYDIEVQLTVQRVETHLVKVRDGEVTSYRRNGQPMSERRTLDTWSVPGMLETIERDLEHVAAVARGTGDRFTPQLDLWGTFDSHYGYPDRYRRVQYQRWQANVVVSWKVISFKAYDARIMPCR